MRVAILYICTGNYTVFWEGFYASCEKYFLADYERQYFVFTDGTISQVDNPRVHRIEQARLGWPNDTLKRFHLFSRIKDELASFDYIFFLNANVLFTDDVGEDILPSEEEGIVVVQHPGFYHRPRKDFHYERATDSRAYIADDEGVHYVCGGVNGGRSKDYLRMIDSLREAIDDDEQRNIIARWHDESHINRYIIKRPYKLLSPSYCYPEERHIPFLEKIIILNKERFGGHDFLRKLQTAPAGESQGEREVSTVGKMKRFLRFIWDTFRTTVAKNSPFLHDSIERLRFDIDARKRIKGLLRLPLTLSDTIPPGTLVKASYLNGCPKKSVKEVYVCHALGYASREEVGQILRAWRSVLLGDAIVRIVGLDKDILESEYRKDGAAAPISFSDWFCKTYGTCFPMTESVLSFFRVDEMEQLLKDTGYCDVEQYPLVPHFCNSPPLADKLYEVEDSSLLRNAERQYISYAIRARKGQE